MEEAWKRLGVKNGRDSLARLTDIPATNLSSMNTGKKPMTVATAKKIAEATGITLLELGAPLEAVEGDERDLFFLLAEARDEAERGRGALLAALGSIDARLSQIERRLGLPEEPNSAVHP